MFPFVKMKFKTYNKACSKICKEKTRSISQKRMDFATKSDSSRRQKDQCNLRYFKLLRFESLQRPSENQSKYAKFLENHSKHKYCWNSLTRGF